MTTVPQVPEVPDEAFVAEDADKDIKIPKGFGELPWIMSHVNKAASLVLLFVLLFPSGG